jgi:hypothetical protein
MSTLTDYFAKNAYKPKYLIGDRVSIRFNKQLMIGTVGNDRTKVGGDPNPEVVVHLDLPFKDADGKVHTVFITQHKNVKLLDKF